MRVLGALLCIVTQIGTVNANVEKTIFLGPSLATLTLTHAPPDIGDLHFHRLSLQSPIYPTKLPVQFPSESSPHGLESWYLLGQLEEGRRYEVRICWPATQPTDFWLDTFTFNQVYATPELIYSLAKHSEEYSKTERSCPTPKKPVTYAVGQSALFLRVQAAASFYTTNRTLMDFPEPVDVDIILDPFILNILPASLGPFALYGTAVSIGAWFLSSYIYRWLLSIAGEALPKPHKD